MIYLKHSRGFTLSEMLVVLLVIAILAFIAMPIYRNTMLRSYASDAISVLNEVAAKQEVFYSENGVYASDFDSLHPPIKGLSGSGGITLGKFKYYIDDSCAVATAEEYKIFKNYKTQESFCYGKACTVLKGLLQERDAGCDVSLGG